MLLKLSVNSRTPELLRVPLADQKSAELRWKPQSRHLVWRITANCLKNKTMDYKLDSSPAATQKAAATSKSNDAFISL